MGYFAICSDPHVCTARETQVWAGGGRVVITVDGKPYCVSLSEQVHTAHLNPTSFMDI